MKQINFASIESVINKGIELLKTDSAKVEFGQLTKVKIDHNGRHLENKMATSLISAIELKGDKAIEIDLTAIFNQSGDGIDNKSIKERRAILIKISFIKAVLRTIVTLYNAVAALGDLFRSSIANLKELAKSGILIVDPIRDLKKLKHVCERKSTVHSKHTIPVDKYLWNVSSSQAKAGSMKLMSFIRSGYVTVWVTGNTVELFSHEPIAYLDKGVILHAYPIPCLTVTSDYVKFKANPELIKKIIAYNKKYANDLKQSKLDHDYQALSDYVIKHKVKYTLESEETGAKDIKYITLDSNSRVLLKLIEKIDVTVWGPNEAGMDANHIQIYANPDKINSFVSKVWKDHQFEGSNSIKGCKQSDLDQAYEALSDYVIKNEIACPIYDLTYYRKMWVESTISPNQELYKLFDNCGIDLIGEDDEQFPNSGEEDTYAKLHKDQVESFIAKVWKGQYKLEGFNSRKGRKQSDLDQAYEVLSDYVIKHKIPYSYRATRTGKMWIADSCTPDEDVRKKLFHDCGIPTFTEISDQCSDSSKWDTYAIINKHQVESFIPKVWKGHRF